MWLAQEQEKKDAAAKEVERARERLEELRQQERESLPEISPEAAKVIERLQVHSSPDTQARIAAVCDDIRDFLLEKNAQYGDSAISPVRIFSRASAEEQLYVRIDDKLSRLARGDDRLESDEDVVDDLIGYLILLKVARSRADS